MNKRYFAYVRVSTVKQGERGSSLAEQKSAIEAYARRNALSIAGWFEEMETAAKQGRREFSRLLNDLKRGKAGGLIVHKIDRSARNLRDWAELGDLIDRGIDVRFVSDNFDLLSRGGRLSADIQAVVAADYIRNLREEVKKGIYGRLKQGIYPFGAPMGYLNTGKGNLKVIDPVKGPLVRRLFERYGTNTVSFEELRHEFAGMGLRTRAGNPVAPNTLSDILNNPFYAGVIRLGTTGETFAGAHEPLIPKALFDRVQAILRGKTVPKAWKHQVLFRQMIRCGACGRRMLTGEHQKSFVYYRCHSGTCQGVSWREDVLEQALLDQLARIRFTSADVAEIGELIREELRGRGDEGAKVKAALSLQLQNVENRLSRLTDLLIDGAIDQATYNDRKERFLLERRGILDALQSGDGTSPLQDVLTGFERNNSEILRYESLIDDEKRELLDIVCSNVSVCGKSVVFTLRTPYREIADTCDSAESAHHRDDVRTFPQERVFKVVSILWSVPSRVPANDNERHAMSYLRPHVPSSPARRHPDGKGGFPEALAA